MPRMHKKQDALPCETASERPAEFLEILARGLKVLEAFRDRRQPMTLSDVATQVGIPRATARRALLTLVELGFVENQGRLFILTPRVLSLASAYLTSADVPTIMQPVVERLSLNLGEACAAAVLDGDDAVFVARANPQRIISVGLEIGYRLPASGTAVGRVLLSGLPDDDLDRHLDRADPQKLTERSITSRKKLRAAVIAVRRDGYHIADQEVEPGFRSIAVPVFGADGRVKCALHVGTHVVSMPVEQALTQFLPLLREAAAQASPLLI